MIELNMNPEDSFDFNDKAKKLNWVYLSIYDKINEAMELTNS